MNSPPSICKNCSDYDYSPSNSNSPSNSKSKSTDILSPTTTSSSSSDSNSSSNSDGGGHNPFHNSATGIAISFEDLRYTVPLTKRRGKKHQNDNPAELDILKGLSGCFEPGTMTALVGPSGSGKTTLLDVLSSRKSLGTLTGHTYFNGTVPTSRQLTSVVGYVEQFDTLVAELTVEQCFRYTAELKLSQSMGFGSAEERERRVEEVIHLLELEKCRKTVIGRVGRRNISGGQAKRVNIGLALITRPKILFLDEPTSGLDSAAADNIINVLRHLARDGNRTIVCTIHSPSGSAFSMFDHLLMMKEGQTIYDGPLDEAQPHFESIGYERNPASSLPEWLAAISGRSMVDLGTDEDADKEPDVLPTEKKMVDEEAIEIQKASAAMGGSGSKDDEICLATAFRSSEASRKSVIRRKSTMDAYSTAPIVEKKRKTLIQKATQVPKDKLGKLKTLLKYRMRAHFKSPGFIIPRLAGQIVSGILMGAFYFGMGARTTSTSIIATSSLLFFSNVMCAHSNAIAVPGIALERALFQREINDGCYGPCIYYLHKFMEEGIMAAISSLCFATIVYFACQLQGNFGIFYLSYYCVALFAITLAYMIAATTPSIEAANAMIHPLITLSMFLGGLFLVFDEMPIYLYYVSWASFIRYGWGAMLNNEFRGLPNGEHIITDDGDENPLTILEFYGMRGPVMGNVAGTLGVLGAISLMFMCVGIYGLKLLRFEKR